MDELNLENARKDAELKRDSKKWTNRRRMSWMSLIGLFAMTVYIFYGMPLERIEALKGMIEWMYLLFSSIPLTYLGVATYSDIKKR